MSSTNIDALDNVVALRRSAWDKRPNEGVRAFAAFSAYRDMGTARSIAKAAQMLGKSTVTLQRWSTRYSWVERAEAYDVWEEQRTRAVKEDERDRISRQQVQLGELMEGVAAVKISGGQWGEFKVAALDPNTLTPGDVIGLAREGVKTRRLAVGLPTDVTKSLDWMKVSDVAALVEDIVELGLARIPEDQHGLGVGIWATGDKVNPGWLGSSDTPAARSRERGRVLTWWALCGVGSPR